MKYLLLSFALLFIPLSQTSAQANFNTLGNAGGSKPSIELTPTYPGPHSEVEAAINDFSLQSQASGVVWYIDGEKVLEANNQRSVKFKTKDQNDTTIVTAIIEIKGRETITLEQKIKPVYLDIIVEPQTRTPSFYNGRALPSIGSEVNLTAIINGGDITPENITYQWRVNNKLISKGSLRSKYKVSIPISYDANNTVSLVVSKLSGEVLARRDVSIPSVEPKVLFYEADPLYGIKQIPAGRSFNLISNTATLHAEPYYLDILTYNRPSVLEWKIDGVRNPNNNNNPYEITLSRQGGQGKSRLDFHARNLEGLLQGTQGSITVNY